MFGSGWRIILASMAAFFVGDFLNSVVLAKMKIWTEGKHLWTRTIGSTIVGEGADSLIFYPLAFYGMPDWPVATLGAVMLSQFVLKVSWEALLTPVTYAVVGWLKRKEGVDVYDVGTDFTPFTRTISRAVRSAQVAIRAIRSLEAMSTVSDAWTPGPFGVMRWRHSRSVRSTQPLGDVQQPSNTRRRCRHAPARSPARGAASGRARCRLSLRIPAMSRAEPLTSSR